MRMIKRKLARGSQEYHTSLEINEVENEYMVIYSEVGAEPDVGEQGGIEIEGVYFEDQGCVMDQISDFDLDQLALEIGESLQSRHDAAVEDYYSE
jgi:hypothetical protein